MRFPLWRRNQARELHDELESHLAMAVRDRVDRGEPPAQAEAAARREFGNILLVKEVTREMWGWASLERLGQDIRYGIRLLRKSRAFSAVAILTLALGIGMNTTIFTLLNALLLEKLHVKAPEELVLMAEQAGPRQVFSFSSNAFRAFSESQVLAEVAAFRPWRIRTEIHGRAELADGELVSGNFFSLLGVNAIIGRTLMAEDDRAVDAGSVAVLSYHYWRRVLGGDPGIIGSSIQLQGHPFAVIGIAEPRFLGLEPGKEADIYVPLSMQPIVMPGTPLLNASHARWLRLIGRRKPEVSLETVQSGMTILWDHVREDLGERRPAGNSRLIVLPGDQGLYDLRREFSLPLRILMAGVGLVLVIACANLGGLLLARANSRKQEIGIRLLLGASRGRVIRQLLTESVILAVFGGTLATFIGYWCGPLLIRLMSRGRPPIVFDKLLDTRTLIFTAALALGTGLLFGIAPALRTANSASLHGSRLIAGTPHRWTAGFISAQVSLCLVVLACAGLLLGSLKKLREVDPGFRADHVLLMSIRPALSGYEGRRVAQLYADLYQRFSALSGVRSVTLSMDTPLSGASFITGVTVPGWPGPQQDAMQVSVNSIGPRFFETMGIPILMGHDIDFRDDDRSTQVAVVSESVARGLFSDHSPLGEHIIVGQSSLEVIGVVKDTRYQSLREAPQPVVYRPYLQTPNSWEELFFGIRTSGDPRGIMNVLRNDLHETAPNVPVFSLGTLEERVDATLARERMASILSACFGGFALLLAAIGLYGRFAYAVVERTKEIGVRLALGATPTVVMRIILRQVMLLVFTGIVVGLPLSFASTREIRSLLFGLPTFDVWTFCAAIVVLAIVSGIAGFFPAWRAARVDPMIALRYE